MSAQLLQTLLLVLILLVSAVAALRYLLPNLFRRMQTGIAGVLSSPQRHRVVRQWGYWMQPEEAKRGGCGSGLGCGSCNGCGSDPVNPSAAIPLKFTQRPDGSSSL